jgi:C1A family cysteine protease
MGRRSRQQAMWPEAETSARAVVGDPGCRNCIRTMEGMNMKASRWFAVIACTAVVMLGIPGAVHSQELHKAPEKVYTPPPENFGFVPPRFELVHVKREEPLGAPSLQPSSWDWRALGGVTSVKNQNPYGTCWAFGYLGALESQVLINESFIADYSELNIVACNPEGTSCNEGGNAWMVTNYLALLGTIQEVCNPYPGDCPNPDCVNPACAFIKRVTEWRIIPNDVNAIKEAVMTYGPVYTGIYASFSGFSTYDGSYCLVYTGTEIPNHAVLIVGWDDAMCGGAGGWIVKNSWGTSWGDDGYFYIRYGSASIGMYTSVPTEYEEYDPDETIYHWDEWGWLSSVGYLDRNDWGMVAFTPTSSDELTAVDFWAGGSPTYYSIYIYDEFAGGLLGTLLVGPISGTLQEEGYYSITLPTPLLLTEGDPIYVAVQFMTPNYDYPIPYDSDGPMGTNKSFVSNAGTTWQALDLGNYGYGDVGIRARVSPPYEPGSCINDATSLSFDPTSEFPTGVIEIYPGQELGPFQLAICIEGTDTICVHAEDTEGWFLGGDVDECSIIADDCWEFWNVYVQAPLTAEICDYDTVRAILAVCDVNGVCTAACGVDTTTLVLHVVEPPPSILVLQDSLSYVDSGVAVAFVPFAICNDQPAASPRDYDYTITSLGYVGSAIAESGTLSGVSGGECGVVYAAVDAGEASVCDYDTLTIIAWTGTAPDRIYDTCVQVIHVIEPLSVPLLSAWMIALLAVVSIAVSAVCIRRRALGSR